MKRHSGWLLVAVLGLGMAASQAGATPFAGTLTVAVGVAGASIGPLQFPGTASGTSTASTVTLPGGVFAGTASAPVVGLPPLTRIVVSVGSNGPGAFAGSPLGGAMPVHGQAVVKGYIAGPGSVTLAVVPFFTNHTPLSAAGAAGLGVGGSILMTFGGNPSVYLDVFNTSWSAGPKTLTGMPQVFAYHIPAGGHASQTVQSSYFNATAMYTGTDSRTPGGLGQVTLVSPTKVATTLNGSSPGNPFVIVALGKLTLNFVPEPSTLLLLGSGVAGLAFLGRRKSRRD